MLNRKDQEKLYAHGYLPEHLPAYLESVTGSEPHLRGDHLYLFKGTHLTFIGYPLKKDPATTPGVYEALCKDLQPETVAIIAPKIWLPSDIYEAQPEDDYFRLELPQGVLPRGVAYMVRRAKRELRVVAGSFGREHKRLIREFVSAHSLTPAQKKIYKAIPDFLKGASTARLLEARKGDQLVAFNILDLGSADYAFYLFNFRSHKINMPGASDLLFVEMLDMAQAEGKGAMNLGLGINPGIRHFKEKWGARPFLTHASALVQRKSPGLGSLANKL